MLIRPRADLIGADLVSHFQRRLEFDHVGRSPAHSTFSFRVIFDTSPNCSDVTLLFPFQIQQVIRSRTHQGRSPLLGAWENSRRWQRVFSLRLCWVGSMVGTMASHKHRRRDNKRNKDGNNNNNNNNLNNHNNNNHNNPRRPRRRRQRQQPRQQPRQSPQRHQ